MFIATRLPLIISATSEMLSISLFAEEVSRPCTFYKHYVPTARFRPDSFERLLLRQSRLGTTGCQKRPWKSCTLSRCEQMLPAIRCLRYAPTTGYSLAA